MYSTFISGIAPVTPTAAKRMRLFASGAGRLDPQLKIKKWGRSDPRQLKWDLEWTRFLVSTNSPMRLLDTPAMKDLMAFAAPHALTKGSRTHLK